MDFFDYNRRVVLPLPYMAQMESSEQGRAWLVIASLLLCIFRVLGASEAHLTETWTPETLEKCS